MNSFILKTSSSYGAVAMLETLIKSGCITFNRLDLKVRSHVTDSKNIEDWPVIFTCKSDIDSNREFKIYIQMLTCGYGGTGPNDLIKVIKMTGFDNFISADEIYTNKVIDRSFDKKN